MAIHCRIVDGPSKWDLVLGLFDNTMSNPRSVTFTLDNGTTLEVVLNEIERKSGSGEDWCFKGGPRPFPWSREKERPFRTVGGYFDTRRRKGHLHRFTDEAEQRAFVGCTDCNT